MDPRHWPLDRRATLPGTIPTTALRADPTYGQVRDSETPPRDPTGQLQAEIGARLRVLNGEAQNHIEVLTGRRLQQVVRPPDEQVPDAPPVLTALEPNTVALGQPSFTIHVKGTGFTSTDVILWNGGAEPTTFVSATELTTGVNMDTAAWAVTIPVAVSGAAGVSNDLPFTFTEAAPGV